MIKDEVLVPDYKGKNISALYWDSLEDWDDLDTLLNEGYEIIGIQHSGGFGGGAEVLILKNPKPKDQTLNKVYKWAAFWDITALPLSQLKTILDGTDSAYT